MILDPFIRPFPVGLFARLKRYSFKHQHQQSAGCVVYYRSKPNLEPEVLLIHRGGIYNDWVFPKGKIENNKNPESEAIRESFEEAGLKVRIITKLTSDYYTFFMDEKKLKISNQVHYFLAKSANQKVKLEQSSKKNEASDFIEYGWFNIDMATQKVKFPIQRKILLEAKSYIYDRGG